jgi:hypothetical protein
MKFFVKYGFLPLIVILITGCSLFEDDGPKDPRDYTWTIDTLYYETSLATNMEKIWGSAWNDMYAVGNSGAQPGIMWHFDGAEWSPYPFYTASWGSIAKPLDLNNIFGIGKDDFWVVGEEWIRSDSIQNYSTGFVAQYKGEYWGWEDHSSALEDFEHVYGIGGSSSQDMWVGGSGGRIYRYNGQSWQKDSVAVLISDATYSKVYEIAINEQYTNYAILHNPRWNSDIRSHYLKNTTDGNWIEIKTLENQGIGNLWYSENGNIFAAGNQTLWKIQNEEWISIGNFPQNEKISYVNGISENHFFAAGSIYEKSFKGQLYFYNGKSLTQLLDKFDLKNMYFRDIWSDKENVFILGNTLGFPSKTIIIRGR